MKYSVAFLAALATLVAAQPKFLNSDYKVVPGQPFTLKFSGCDEGCDIILQNGDSKNLKDVQTLVSDTKGPAETLTLSPNFPKDTYAFKIVPLDGGAPNYSPQFQFEGVEKPTTSATPTPTSTTAESTSTTSTKATTTMVSVSTKTTTTPAPESTTTEAETSTTTGDNSQETDVPDAAIRLGSSPVTAFAAIVAIAGYFL